MNCIFSHILVLLDCTPVDDAIISKVLGMATCGNIKITLAHVVHSHTIDQDRVFKKKTDACINARMAQFVAAGVNVSPLILSGEPEIELVKEINNGTYDLVALATHGHKFFSDLLYGSVSEHLKHEVAVPLLLVRGNPL
jgi:universal stress protein A